MNRMLELKSFKSIVDLLKAFPTEQDCITHLEIIRWKGKVVSPFDPNSSVYSCKNNRYKCRNTNKYFNVRTNTIFEGTKISLQQWFLAIYIFTSHKKGISSVQLSKDLDITQKASWFVLHRLRYAMNQNNFINFISGTVEVDETFVGGKNKNRHPHKKVINSQGRAFIDKTPVLGILNRDNGCIKCFVVEDTKAKTIQPVILNNVEQGSTIMSDEWWAYNGLNKFYKHKIINHSNKEFVKEDCYTNTIEGFWSLFKRGIIGIYHFTSRTHLQKYADEFSFRYNHRENTIDKNFNIFLQTTNDKRLTYKTLINK
jgi:transposase-like protein